MVEETYGRGFELPASPGWMSFGGLVEIIVRLLLRPTARNMTSAMGTNVILSCWVGSIGAPI
jgi:hypothetical protein